MGVRFPIANHSFSLCRALIRYVTSSESHGAGPVDQISYLCHCEYMTRFARFAAAQTTSSPLLATRSWKQQLSAAASRMITASGTYFTSIASTNLDTGRRSLPRPQKAIEVVDRAERRAGWNYQRVLNLLVQHQLLVSHGGAVGSARGGCRYRKI